MFLAFRVAASVCPAVGALLTSTVTQTTMVAGSGMAAVGAAIRLPAHRRETPRPASPGGV